MHNQNLVYSPRCQYFNLEDGRTLRSYYQSTRCNVPENFNFTGAAVISLNIALHRIYCYDENKVENL
jgi:hypothetical protein